MQLQAVGSQSGYVQSETKKNEAGLFRRGTTHMKSSGFGRRKNPHHKRCKKFFEFSFIPQCVRFTLAVHLGTSVVHIALKERTSSHEHHLAYA